MYRSATLRDDLETGALDHFTGRRVTPSVRGQIAVDEDRVDGVEQVEQAEQAGRLETALGRKPPGRFERRARNRMQKIYRHRIDCEAASRVGEVEQVVVLFAHPDDPARAGAKASRANIFDGRNAVIP